MTTGLIMVAGREIGLHMSWEELDASVRKTRLDCSAWVHRDDHGGHPFDRKPQWAARQRKKKEREPIT